MPTMDAYVRVSRVGKRQGDAYRSPGIQEDEIGRWADHNGVQIGKTIKDEDVSGAKAIADRGLQELIRRAEAGASAGVIVYALDRFGRDELDAGMAVKKLTDAGARLVSATEGVDSSRNDPASKMALKMFLMFAEAYLDRVRSNWKDAADGAISEGIHIAGQPPTGYVRKDRVEPEYNDRNELIRNGRLLIEPNAAKVVREIFELRAEGRSYGRLTGHLEKGLGRSVGKSAARAIIRNRAYLGEARRGEVVNKEAHLPIVSPELFAAANARTSAFVPREGAISEQALLGGVVTCASCGHKMGIIGSGKSKGRKAHYHCARVFASGNCEAPCAAMAKRLDDYVIQKLAGAWEYVVAAAGSEEQDYLIAKQKLADAEDELGEWLDDPALGSGLSRESRRRGILAREKAVEHARAAMYALPDPGIEDAPILWLDGKPVAYEVWGEDRDADRRLLRKFVKSVTVAPADPKRRRWQPIEERVTVEFVGQSVDVTAGLAEAIEGSARLTS